MMAMLDPQSVYAAAAQKEEENLKFRSFLKNRADGDKLDQQFLELHNELFAEYDCCQCRNCCKDYNISLQADEICAIASFLGMDEQSFTEKYLMQAVAGYEIPAPCRFLAEDGKCGIQQCQPAVCKDYPHTNKPGRLESLLGVMYFAEQCPVVFEIVERLKRMYGFR
jgi:Fe-S-cluster containining protein